MDKQGRVGTPEQTLASPQAGSRAAVTRSTVGHETPATPELPIEDQSVSNPGRNCHRPSR